MYIYTNIICIYIHTQFCVWYCVCVNIYYMHAHIYSHVKHTYFKLKKLTSEENNSLLEKYVLKLFGSPINAI